MTTAVSMSLCPRCGGPRANIAPPDTPALLECTRCGAVESALVGVVERDDDLLPPPPEEDELLPPPPDEAGTELGPAAAAAALTQAFPGLVTTSPSLTLHLAQTPEVLPADFQLPPAITFVPNPALATRAQELAAQIADLVITDEASCHRMDALLAIARAHDAAIDAHFADPVDFFFARHRALTRQRGEFRGPLTEAIKIGGRRIFAFNQAQERQAAEERRRRQEAADRQARDDARREAEAARQAQAPAPLIEQLEEQAQTVTAPPVASAPAPRETLRGSTVTITRKARPKGTEGAAADQQPGMAMLTPAQRLSVLEAMKAVVDGRAPLLVFEIAYAYLDSRAKSDKTTFNIPGFEMYEVGGVRGKSTRVK